MAGLCRGPRGRQERAPDNSDMGEKRGDATSGGGKGQDVLRAQISGNAGQHEGAGAQN